MTRILVTMGCRAPVFASESCRHRLQHLQPTMQSNPPRNIMAQALLSVITAVGILQPSIIVGLKKRRHSIYVMNRILMDLPCVILDSTDI